MNKNAVTFIIIAFNEERTILNCIDAIHAQDYIGEFSIVVVNDASEDQTLSILKKLIIKNKNISISSNKNNSGRGFSRNRGLSLSTSEFVAYIDADIVIPRNWLSRCMLEIKDCDCVGGIAVPDGDVQFVFNLFKLTPKIKKHTVSVTGSNGLFRKRVLEKTSFLNQMKNGEDVDLSWRLEKQGVRIKSLPDLICLHRETKTFYQSIAWLFQSGIGASGLFKIHQRVRLPDVVSYLFFAILLLSISYSIVFGQLIVLLLPALFALLVSALHLSSKFFLKLSSNTIGAILTNSILMTAYFLGRLVGMATK